MSDTTTIDEARAEAFAGTMVSILNHGALALMCSIGHRTGLFDTMAHRAAATSDEMSQFAELDERYVREWLAAMTTGGIFEYDPATRTYRLPPEHAQWVTRAAGADNLALQTQFIGMLARVEELVEACFREGGGVGYEHYQDFHRLMAEDSASVHDNALIEVMLPIVDGLPDRLRSGINVADIGCGSGHAINLMAKHFPSSTFVGYDVSEEGISVARAEAESWGLANATFETRDVADLGAEARFDLVTAFDAIHDQAHPAKVLVNIHHALRPGGTFLMVDIQGSSAVEDNLDHPLAPFLYSISTMHCMTVSLAEDGDGLGTMWGEQLARSMLADAGFESVEVINRDDDPLNSWYIARKG
jgi:2-polyprenyl-3-methyl-5-hydroxy-6-metoxy-1,4-benzoquinol methylase